MSWRGCLTVVFLGVLFASCDSVRTLSRLGVRAGARLGAGADAHAAAAVKESESAAPSSEQISSAMSQIDSQVNSQLALHPTPQLQPLQAPPGALHDPITDVQTHPRFKASPADVVQALNSLDLKTINATIKPPPKRAFPRDIVAAYGSIAAETVQRANYALLMLKNQRESLLHTLQAQQHDMLAWVAQQKKVAEGQIHVQEMALGRLEDEIAHLQHVYQDAVAKERSYQVQGNMLVSERQLQRTPPVMPVEVATSLSDAEYKSAIEKLSTYQKAAQGVMAQTAAHIAVRKKMADQTREWIRNARQTLQEWLKLQHNLIARRVAETQHDIKLNQDRTSAVATMSNDATTAFKEYAKTIARLDIKNRVGELEVSRRKWVAAKARTPYDDAQAKSYAVALKIEIQALVSRLKHMPGDDKVYPPPSVWGILSGFPSGPKVEFPDPFKPEKTAAVLRDPHSVWIHQPSYMPLQRPVNPHVRFGVPTAEEHEDLQGVTSPTISNDVLMGTGDLFARHNYFPGALSQFAAAPQQVAMQGEAEKAALEVLSEHGALGSSSSEGSGSSSGSGSRFRAISPSGLPSAPSVVAGAAAPGAVPPPPPNNLPELALPSMPSLVEQSSTVHLQHQQSHSTVSSSQSRPLPSTGNNERVADSDSVSPATAAADPLAIARAPLPDPPVFFTMEQRLARPKNRHVDPPSMPDLPEPPDSRLVMHI